MLKNKFFLQCNGHLQPLEDPICSICLALEKKARENEKSVNKERER